MAEGNPRNCGLAEVVAHGLHLGGGVGVAGALCGCETGVEALIHYPQPLPDMRYYREHYPTSPAVYPVASRLAGEILTLPIHPWLDDADAEYVVARISQFYRD